MLVEYKVIEMNKITKKVINFSELPGVMVHGTLPVKLFIKRNGNAHLLDHIDEFLKNALESISNIDKHITLEGIHLRLAGPYEIPYTLGSIICCVLQANRASDWINSNSPFVSTYITIDDNGKLSEYFSINNPSKHLFKK